MGEVPRRGCVGVRGAHSFTAGCRHPFRPIPGVTNSIRVKTPRQGLQGQEGVHEPTKFRERPDRRQGSWILGIGWDFHPRRKGGRETIVR